MLDNNNLKKIDFEILRQIKDYNDRGMKIINYDFRSSTKNIRIAKMKKEGFIGKEGKQKGKGTLFLTEIGIKSLERLSEKYGDVIKSKIGSGNIVGHYKITWETIEGKQTHGSIEYNGKPEDILDALSNIGNCKKGESC